MAESSRINGACIEIKAEGGRIILAHDRLVFRHKDGSLLRRLDSSETLAFVAALENIGFDETVVCCRLELCLKDAEHCPHIIVCGAGFIYQLSLFELDTIRRQLIRAHGQVAYRVALAGAELQLADSKAVSS